LFIDSNIFISAFFSPSGVPSKVIKLAAELEFRRITSQFNLREMWNVFERKFPDKVLNFQLFMAENIQRGLEVVETPELELVLEGKVRDAKDRPILRAAIFAKADIFLLKPVDCVGNIGGKSCLHCIDRRVDNFTVHAESSVQKDFTFDCG